MYQRDIGAYLAYAEREALEPLDSATMARWRVHLSNTESEHSRPFSPQTINRIQATVKRLMAETAQQGVLATIVIQLPKVHRPSHLIPCTELRTPVAKNWYSAPLLFSP